MQIVFEGWPGSACRRCDCSIFDAHMARRLPPCVCTFPTGPLGRTASATRSTIAFSPSFSLLHSIDQTAPLVRHRFKYKLPAELKPELACRLRVSGPSGTRSCCFSDQLSSGQELRATRLLPFIHCSSVQVLVCSPPPRFYTIEACLMENDAAP